MTLETKRLAPTKIDSDYQGPKHSWAGWQHHGRPGTPVLGMDYWVTGGCNDSTQVRRPITARPREGEPSTSSRRRTVSIIKTRISDVRGIARAERFFGVKSRRISRLAKTGPNGNGGRRGGSHRGGWRYSSATRKALVLSERKYDAAGTPTGGMTRCRPDG